MVKVTRELHFLKAMMPMEVSVTESKMVTSVKVSQGAAALKGTIGLSTGLFTDAKSRTQRRIRCFLQGAGPTPRSLQNAADRSLVRVCR